MRDRWIKVPAHICYEAYDIFNNGQPFALELLINFGARLLLSGYQAHTTQSPTLLAITLLDIKEIRHGKSNSNITVPISSETAHLIREATRVTDQNGFGDGLEVATVLSLTEILTHASRTTENAQENRDIPPEFFSVDLALEDGYRIEIEPYQLPRLLEPD